MHTEAATRELAEFATAAQGFQTAQGFRAAQIEIVRLQRYQHQNRAILTRFADDLDTAVGQTAPAPANVEDALRELLPDTKPDLTVAPALGWMPVAVIRAAASSVGRTGDLDVIAAATSLRRRHARIAAAHVPPARGAIGKPAADAYPSPGQARRTSA